MMPTPAGSVLAPGVPNPLTGGTVLGSERARQYVKDHQDRFEGKYSNICERFPDVPDDAMMADIIEVLRPVNY